MLARLVKRLKGKVAKSTHRRRSRVLDGEAEMAQTIGVSRAESDLPAALFLEEQVDRRRGTSMTGVLTYARTLRALRRKEKSETPNVDDFIETVVKAGGGVPDRQAIPLTGEHLELMLSHCNPRQWVALRLAWKTVSRIGEICAITAGHFLWEEHRPMEMGIEWLDSTKGGKKEPFAPQNYTHVVFRDSEVRLFRALKAMRKDERISPWPTSDHFYRWLKALPAPLNKYSDHSIKRGAAKKVSRLVRDLRLPPHLIDLLEKHGAKDVAKPVGASSMGYTRDLDTVAVIGTGLVTKHL